MNSTLKKVIPFVRIGPVRIHTTIGDMDVAEISNVVIYNKQGDFFLRLGEELETSQAKYKPNTELPCWDIIGIKRYGL